MAHKKHYATFADIGQRAARVARCIQQNVPHEAGSRIAIHGVPRGGVPAALAVLAATATNGLGNALFIVDDPALADCFVDDIIDSGATRARYCDKYGKPFFALYSADTMPIADVKPWIVFPWEGDSDSSIADNVTRILQYIGEDPTREGLRETPARVIKAWDEWTSGYGQQPKDVLKCFADGADGCDEMVLVRDIPFYSLCEHHAAPFFGSVTVGYIPKERIVGLSKIPRLVDIFAKRLQVQERMTNQIADAMQNHLTPTGVGVVVTARHLCVESRGIAKQGHTTVTSALRGVMKENGCARSEFLELARPR